MGIQRISIGPECGPVSSGYEYGELQPGAPGDDVSATLAAEIARSERTIAEQAVQIPIISCITALRPNPTGNAAPTDVTIELPSDTNAWVGDGQIWSGESRGVRVGIPVPPATSVRMGSAVR